MTPTVSAVIVNYNAGEELRSALQSIAAEMSDAPWEAVVIDNASVDGSASIAEAFAPQARLIRNGENVGFGRAVNQGIAASRAPLVLIVNPDCRLEQGAIAALSRELAAHPSCAVVGPRILDPDGKLQGSARGDPDMLTGFFGRTSTVRRLVPWLSVARRNVLDVAAAGEKSIVVDWVSGACMLARRRALEAVGGFDEAYFLYWEDADLCRRLRAKGYHVRYVPGGTAIHGVGRSSRTASQASIRAFHASAYRYYATHVAPGAFNPKRLVAQVLLAIRCRWKLRQDLADELRDVIANREAGGQAR